MFAEYVYGSKYTALHEYEFNVRCMEVIRKSSVEVGL